MSSKQECLEHEGRGSMGQGFLATVAAIVSAVPEGSSPFVVTYPAPESLSEIFTDKTSITFSLSKWSDDEPPELGQIVALRELTRYARGWRAKSAHPVIADTSSKQ